MEVDLTLIILDFNMTIYSTSVESTRHPGTIRYLKYMKFLKESDLKRMFHNYISETIVIYDFVREFKLGSSILYVALKRLFPGIELLSIYEDRKNKERGVLATMAPTDSIVEEILKEFMRITHVKEVDVPIEELEKEVMENIEFYKKM